MPRGTREKTKNIALCALLCAMSVAVMFLGAIINTLSLTLAAAASFCVFFAVIELGGAYPWMLYTVCAVLSLILLPDKEPALMYALFLGFYPILKNKFERYHYIIAWILKLSLLNTSVIAIYIIAKLILRLPEESFGFLPGLWALANAAFIIFDIAAGRLILIYIVKFRRYFKR